MLLPGEMAACRTSGWSVPIRGGRTPCRVRGQLPNLRTAFTLVEMLVSAALLSVIMLAVGSVFRLAARTLPGAAGVTEPVVAAALSLEPLTSELRAAISVKARTSTDITFSIPDTTGDGLAEGVRYTWDGTGSPLMRQLNEDAPAAVTGPLADFAFSYVVVPVTVTETREISEDSGEMLLSGFTGWPGVSLSAANEFQVSSTRWCSEAFEVDRVVFPPDATRWYISRVSLRSRRSALASATATSVAVCLPAAPGSRRAGAVVGTPGTIASKTQPLITGWVDVPLTDVSFTDMFRRDLVLLIYCSGAHSSFIEYLSSSSAPLNSCTFLWSTDAGATWQPSNNQHYNDAPFLVYGGYVRTYVGQVSRDTWCLARISIRAQAAGERTPPFLATVSLMNRPEVSTP